MWGTNANCHAYACNRMTPNNGISGAALPGAYAGHGDADGMTVSGKPA